MQGAHPSIAYEMYKVSSIFINRMNKNILLFGLEQYLNCLRDQEVYVIKYIKYNMLKRLVILIHVVQNIYLETLLYQTMPRKVPSGLPGLNISPHIFLAKQTTLIA